MINERKRLVKNYTLIGVVSLLLMVASFIVGIYFGINNNQTLTAVFMILGCVLICVSVLIFKHLTKIKKIYCPKCGKKYDFKKDVTLKSAKSKQFILSIFYTSKVEFNCHCTKCGHKRNFKKTFTYTGDMPEENSTGLKAIKESVEEYFL